MIKIIDAVFDGEVFRPDSALELKPNTRVKLTFEFTDASNAKRSFLETARGMKLTGPSDWSENVDAYLYGDDQATP